MPLAGSLVLAAGCPEGSLPSEALALPEDPTVIILVMDGARVEESLGDSASSATGLLPSAMMPSVWSDLMPLGVRATSAWTLSSSTTVPSHAAIVTGRRLPVANYPATGEPGAYRPTLPLLAEELRAARPELSSMQVITAANTELLRTLTHSLWHGDGLGQDDSYLVVTDPADEESLSNDDGRVLEVLKEYMLSSDLRLALVNLHQVDRSGHYGDEQAYPDAVRAIDRPIAGFWSWLQEQDTYRDRTWLLLLSDHGRHASSGSDPPWRHHGCSCAGCRHVPFLLLGPGVSQGCDLDSPVLLTDVAPTIGALMGVGMPWADGLVRDDLLSVPTNARSRSGLADLALAGSHRAVLHYQDDPGHRSSLVVDGLRASDPDALVVEAPTMAASDDRAWLCWRDVLLAPDPEKVQWKARCLTTSDGGTSWEEMSFAQRKAGPYGRPVLTTDGEGELVAAWVHSPIGSTSGGGDENAGSTVSLRLAHWDGQDWTETKAETAPSFPTDLDMVRHGDHFRIAVAAGHPAAGSTIRHTRAIWLGSATWTGDGFEWIEPTPVDLDDLAPDDSYWRVEYPALHVDGADRLWLAATGLGSDGDNQALVAVTDDAGRSWSQATTLALPQAPMPHLPPVWLGDRAVWATADTGTLETTLCAGLPEQQVRCVGTDAERVLRLRVDGDELWALVDLGEGEWEAQSWTAEDFAPLPLVRAAAALTP